jgi:hypothetical protein
MGPAVARVSAPRIMPSWKRQPTMVVPVLVALGSLTPLSARYAFLREIGTPFEKKRRQDVYLAMFEKSKPVAMAVKRRRDESLMRVRVASERVYTSRCLCNNIICALRRAVLTATPFTLNDDDNDNDGRLEDTAIRPRQPQPWPVSK